MRVKVRKHARIKGLDGSNPLSPPPVFTIRRSLERLEGFSISLLNPGCQRDLPEIAFSAIYFQLSKSLITLNTALRFAKPTRVMTGFAWRK
jgi:hypothetical protein